MPGPHLVQAGTQDDQTDGGPLLDALGISVEQAEEMRLAMQAEQDKS